MMGAMTDPTLPTELRTALQVVTMPRDANKYGTIFGGVILSYIDQAGFIEVRRHGMHRWVTVALESVEFYLVGVPALRNLIREDKTAQILSVIQTGAQHGPGLHRLEPARVRDRRRVVRGPDDDGRI